MQSILHVYPSIQLECNHVDAHSGLTRVTFLPSLRPWVSFCFFFNQWLVQLAWKWNVRRQSIQISLGGLFAYYCCKNLRTNRCSIPTRREATHDTSSPFRCVLVSISSVKEQNIFLFVVRIWEPPFLFSTRTPAYTPLRLPFSFWNLPLSSPPMEILLR